LEPSTDQLKLPHPFLSNSTLRRLSGCSKLVVKEQPKMIEIVWEFVVKQEQRGQFELIFGPGGAWSKLFAGSVGYRGTTVLRSTEDPQRYLVIDIWDSEDKREQMLAECQAEHADLETTLAEWIESKNVVGVFKVLADATVRPHRKAPRSGKRDPRRSSR
jgi:heme-degrading monooxygenase HmoA